MVKLIFTIVLALSFSTLVFSQQAKVSCPEAVVNSQNFELTFTVNSKHVSNVQLEESAELTVKNRSKPRVSSMTSINSVNGISKQVATTTLTYICIPIIQSGMIQTPVVTYKVGNQEFKSASKTIQVVEQSAVENREKYVCEISLNSDYIFKGEKIVADVKLYFSEDLNEVESGTIPQIEGLFVKEIPLKQIIQSQGVYRGKLYNSAIVKRFEISCDSAGIFEIPSIKVGAIKKVKRPSNGLLTHYDKEITELVSEPVRIEVVKIPENVPDNYLGVFSELEIKTNTPARQTNSDQAVELSIQLSGTGSFKSITPPALTNLNQGYQVYEPELRSSLEDLNFGSTGLIQMNYTLVPKNLGITKTEAFHLYYFNRNTKQFDSLQVKSFNVKVNQTETAEIKDFNKNQAGEITPIPITELKEPSTPLLSRSSFIGSLASIFGMGILVFLGIKINQKREHLKSLIPAKAGADKAYEELDSLVSKTDADFSSNLLETLEDYLIYRFKLNKADFNKQDILPLTDLGLAEKTIKFMKELEMVAFSPASFKGNSDAKANAIDNAKSLITQLENA